MLIPQQQAVPKGKIISYSDPGSAIGIHTAQQIKKQVCLCFCVTTLFLCAFPFEFFGCHLSLAVCINFILCHTE